MLRGYITLATVLASVVSAVGAESAPKATIKLEASVKTIAAGKPFKLALTFDLPDEYHLYWENPGESGLPPTVDWQVPDGFKVGPLQFPAPTLHEMAGIVSYVLEGMPILLVEVTPPADLPVGTAVPLRADVTYLMCKERCYRLKDAVAVTLGSGPAAIPDNEITFRIANQALPRPDGRGSLVTVKTTATQKNVTKGDRFEIVLEVAVKKGFHTQSDKPLGEFFIPTRIFPRRVEGVLFGDPAWPKAHVRKDPIFGEVSEFDGDFKVRLPATVEAPTLARDVRLTGLLTYQACNDKGQCHPPEAVEWSAAVDSASVKAAAGASPGSAVAAGSDGDAGPTPLPAALKSDTATGSQDSAVVEAGAASRSESDPGDGSAARGRANGAGGTTRAGSQGFFGSIEHALNQFGLLGALLGGFLGGLILNVMPCVLPVISIKILSFVQQANESRRRVFQLGLTFAAGIILSFLILALGIIWLRDATGTARGWGSFFQDTRFIILMVTVMFVFALNLFGVFEVMLPGAAAGRLSQAAEREGFTGAFMKGVLATLLATPCTAPFLATAISFALASPVYVTFLIFLSAGVGMASPYVLLTANPGWLKYIKPGAWMVTFKQATGFLLIGAVVWLLWILGAMVGQSGVVWTVGFLAFAAMGCWVYGKIEYGASPGRKAFGYATSLGTVVLGGWFALSMYEPAEAQALVGPIDVARFDVEKLWAAAGDQIPWQSYTAGGAETLAGAGYTVYVDYTAVWCLTCQANKKLVLGNEAVRARMKSLGVVPIKADFTNYDPDMAKDLQRFQRDAVPLNVVFPANRAAEPIVLPVVLTTKVVFDALEEAGSSSGSTLARR